MNLLITEQKTEDIVDKLSSVTNSKEKQKKKVEGMKEEETEENLKEAVKYQTEGVAMETLGAARGPESTIHTSLENLHLDVKVRSQSMLTASSIHCMLKSSIITPQTDNLNTFTLLC